jgi:hypothetical protein
MFRAPARLLRPVVRPPRALTQPVLFPSRYAWYVLVCFLDLIVTNTIIAHFGGVEANAIAQRAIALAGFWGLIAFKVCSMIVVITICEIVGRRREPTGRRVAEWAIALSSIPVVLGLMQIPLNKHRVEPPPRALVLTWVSPPASDYAPR